ncbi:hypothetical protein BOW53_14685 [Solemya pervernicosa gill symbiont]|uniref:histidine kinase n=3 Tax=Gammaproteobacteria incertae sedis TaxID=118884 RepID=A0A1T2L0Q8_9GAMM|nr:hypothetical protein BOW53_14685 [Solemya pervernicosa gill symbiont]QKQ25209.1 GHKL domain-containing protein [Candidatus Reidiella endopervernicosa]
MIIFVVIFMISIIARGTIRKITNIESELSNASEEKSNLITKLEEAQSQLLQSKKLASVGQLAAGVAHEINNPIGYVNLNISTISVDLLEIFRLLDLYGAADEVIKNEAAIFEPIQRLKEHLDLEYLKDDIIDALKESNEGISRVTKIVQYLKEFSHVDQQSDWVFADLQSALDTTLNIANNEIKYKASVIREYGEIPKVECIPSQLNQVFLNLIVNAAHAIEKQGTITIRTRVDRDSVIIEVSDDGCGIPEDIQHRIFDPFYTTKQVGEGTGLGLSLSYGIIQNHNGDLSVESEPGKGTTFTIRLPLEQS